MGERRSAAGAPVTRRVGSRVAGPPIGKASCKPTQAAALSVAWDDAASGRIATAWLGAPPLDLVVTMDDATSEIYSAFLVEEEGTASTFRVVRDRNLPTPGWARASASGRHAHRGEFASDARPLGASVPDLAGSCAERASAREAPGEACAEDERPDGRRSGGAGDQLGAMVADAQHRETAGPGPPIMSRRSTSPARKELLRLQPMSPHAISPWMRPTRGYARPIYRRTTRGSR